MLKTSNWIILFFAIFFALYVPYEYEVMVTTKMEQENLRIEEFGISAAQSALLEGDIYGEHVFSSKKIRERVVDMFYSSYALSANYGTKQINNIKYMVPCLILVDWDGYYVNYTQWFDTTGEVLYTDITTEKNYWMQRYGDYVVQYSLNNTIVVSDVTNSEIRYQGLYADVYETMKADNEREIQELEHLTNADSFEKERNLVVIGEIEATAEYYINTHNELYNKNYTQYELYLPLTKGEQMASCLTTPSVIAFIQGSQSYNEKGNVNIYTYVGADLETDMLYFVTKDDDGELMYHKDGCNAEGEVLYKGTYYDCAQVGANPSACVYNEKCIE